MAQLSQVDSLGMAVCLYTFTKDSMEYIWGGGVMQISSGVGDVMLRYVDGLIFDIQQSMVS